MISFSEAYKLTLEHIQPLGIEIVELLDAADRTAGQELLAKVDSPSLDVSLKDGYAVVSADIHTARVEAPVHLKLIGGVAAGDQWQGIVQPGEAVRILSGAPLPQGANAVIAEEFTQVCGNAISVINDAEPGRNILPRGADVKIGQSLATAGQRLHPTIIGLLAAAGYAAVAVTKRPRVAILSTGDEVLAPGQPFIEGKLYASNLFTLAAWCRRFGFDVETFVLPDDFAVIHAALTDSLQRFDAVLTSGGAWKGERDLVAQILDSIGWQKIYHRVRMGPGKAVGFGLFQNKPIFCLPGGPPSNQMAFLQLALPGLQKLAGNPEPGLQLAPAVITETVSGQVDWTQFIHGRFDREDGRLLFVPMKSLSRLQDMAHTDAIAQIPEGEDELPVGSMIIVYLLNPT